MSNYYGTYSQYLGAQRCCNLKGQGSQGIQGPQGPPSIGAIGNTGPTGASYTGPTGRGCRGPTGPAGSSSGITGPTGVTGTSYWDPSGANAIVYTGQVYINGELDISGGVITTTRPYGVRYNYYSGNPITIPGYTIGPANLYQLVIVNILAPNTNAITLPNPSSMYTDGDWVIITNLSTTASLLVYQQGVSNQFYNMPTLNSANVNSVKFIYYSNGYTGPTGTGTIYWIVGV
jgi:hypothetical protein